MPNNNSFTNHSKLLSLATIIFILITYIIYQQNFENLKIKFLLYYNPPWNKATDCQTNNQDGPSWWNWLQALSFFTAALFENIFSRFTESRELYYFKETIEKILNTEGSLGDTSLDSIKERCKKNLEELSINLTDPNSLKIFFEKNKSSSTILQTKNIQLTEKFMALYNIQASEIIESHSNYFFNINNYKLISNTLRYYSFGLVATSTANILYDQENFSFFILTAVLLTDKLNRYFSFCKPLQALEEHIEQLKTGYSSLLDAIIEIYSKKEDQLKKYNLSLRNFQFKFNNIKYEHETNLIRNHPAGIIFSSTFSSQVNLFSKKISQSSETIKTQENYLQLRP